MTVPSLSTSTKEGSTDTDREIRTVTRSVEVGVPVSTAYNQWTQFEDFPTFMGGVESVTQLDDTRLHWVAEIAGQRREWDATITEQVPDRGIAWVGEGDLRIGGEIAFEPLGADRTRVTVTMSYTVERLSDKIGDWLGLAERRVEGDLERFKAFIENRGVETGAWRGEIQGGRERRAG